MLEWAHSFMFHSISMLQSFAMRTVTFHINKSPYMNSIFLWSLFSVLCSLFSPWVSFRSREEYVLFQKQFATYSPVSEHVWKIYTLSVLYVSDKTLHMSTHYRKQFESLRNIACDLDSNHGIKIGYWMSIKDVHIHCHFVVMTTMQRKEEIWLKQVGSPLITCSNQTWFSVW